MMPLPEQVAGLSHAANLASQDEQTTHQEMGYSQKQTLQ
jgi:hypothetical protein